MSDDPFQDFADAMKSAANLEEQNGTPLLENGGVLPQLQKVTSVAEAAEIASRADAEMKAARMRKKAAEAFIVAIAENESRDAYDLPNGYTVEIQAEEQLSFDGDKWLEDGNATHSLVQIKAALTPAKLRSLNLHAFPEIAKYVSDKGVSKKVIIKRK